MYEKYTNVLPVKCVPLGELIQVANLSSHKADKLKLASSVHLMQAKQTGKKILIRHQDSLADSSLGVDVQS